MVVATFDTSNNARIHSTCQAFDQYLMQIHKLDELNQYTAGEVVFCVEHQIVEELHAFGNDIPIQEIEFFEHGRNDVYVFGENTGQKLATEIIAFKQPYRILQINEGKTLWSEVALGIVLYDRWKKEIK